MIPDLARMAVVIKSKHSTSVITGNYEMAYLCGLMSKLADIAVPVWETPQELLEHMNAVLAHYTPANENEKTAIKMMKYYHPDDTNDEQVKELFEMGLKEEHPWEQFVK